MLKDYFSYSKSERRLATVLIILIALLSGIYIYLSTTKDEESYDRNSIAFQKEVIAFEQSQTRFSKTYNSANNYTNRSSIQISLFNFDPNQIDSISFLRLGLKPFMAKSILKYRKKGGRFRTADDFARVPYLGSDLFLRLKPYIRINEKLIAKRDTFVSKLPTFVRQEKYSEGTLVDLATADTTELKKIPGIASGTAKSIVSYRSRLGGFYSVNQLKELKNISDEQFAKVFKFLTIDEPHITRMPVNKSGFDRLRSHPYLNFYQVKAIIELRKKRGKINSLSELSLLEEFTEKDFERLKYYLDFSQ